MLTASLVQRLPQKYSSVPDEPRKLYKYHAKNKTYASLVEL